MPGAGLQGQRTDRVKPGPEAAGTSQVCMFRWQFRVANRLAPPRPEVLKPCVWLGGGEVQVSQGQGCACRNLTWWKSLQRTGGFLQAFALI